VAAVCYRMGWSGIQFLLVRTRNGRWTFPKGGVEAGLTQAQAAALEAFEEAGVHGRMEEAYFARYVRRKRRTAAPLVVYAYLCEVLRIGRPESGRNPTWFSPTKAKESLQRNRRADFATELASVIDRAVMRIRRLAAAIRDDELQKVRFEAGYVATTYGGAVEASLACDASRLRRAAVLASPENGPIFRLSGFSPLKAVPLLTAGDEQESPKGTLPLAYASKRTRLKARGKANRRNRAE